MHTPETPREKNIETVRRQAKENKLAYPIAIDNQAATWRAWGNRYWPSTYLIDRQGYVRYRWDGELNWKGRKGQEIMRRHIKTLLKEKKLADPPPS